MGEGGTERDQDGGRAQSRAFSRPGVIGSFLLHTAVLGLLLYQVGAPPLPFPVIPVDMVQLTDETAAAARQPEVPPQASGANAPPRLASVVPPRAAVQPPPAPPPPAAPPSAEQPAPDTVPPTAVDSLQSQLDALAKLRIQNGGSRGPSATSIPGSGDAGYRVEDLIRAQVLRRWNLRLDELGESDLVVAIHVVLEPDGTVAKAEIVDTSRTASDDVYRSIALSARNAVLLSSPLTLPAGMTAEMRDMTLRFNTRDTLR